jgi:molecular chaperone IbpA
MTHLNLGRLNFGPLVPQTVGFDRFFDAFDQLALEKLPTNTFPPHNIVKLDENNYLVELAVAGFKDEDIEIEVLNGELTITGKKTVVDENRSYLHRGIGTRSFKKVVRLADTVQVSGAGLEDGILAVSLVNVIPEEKQPKRIPITSGGKNKVLLSKGKETLLQE